MKKILITGGGFIGKHLARYFSDHDVTILSHDTFDLTDEQIVQDFFKDKYFDAVLHTAIQGGRRGVEDTAEVLQNNLKMFYNLMEQREKYDRLINFGSGAEYDRRTNITVSNVLIRSFPIDPYGMSKNIIARGIAAESFKYFNIRIFNVFDIDEEPERFVRANMLRYIKREPFVIHQDRTIDFCSMSDLMKLVHHYVHTERYMLPKDIDAVYKRKYLLSEICDKINELDEHKCITDLDWVGKGLSYTGGKNVTVFTELPLDGLTNSLMEMYKSLKAEYETNNILHHNS